MYQIAQHALCHQLIEIKFQSETGYLQPFSNINLDLTFTDPNGRERTVPAFWAGQSNWIARYSSTIEGKHRFVTSCTDTSNMRLHAIHGELQIIAYTGENALWRHGAPKIAKDQRHFAHDDDTPFFWLGDTWWLGLTKRLRWPDDFKALATDRQNKGFSVVQIVAGFYPDMAAFDARGLSETGFAWEEDYSTIRPAFFDEADQRILHLVELGIVPCVLGAWGYYLQWLGTEKMQMHWRYIMARWGALPVIWAAAGEQTMPWYLSTQKDADSATLKQEWTKVIHSMHQLNGFDRLITTHPHHSARDSVENAELIDFEMQQTGHHGLTTKHAEKALSGWLEAAKMPVVCGESRYEALEIIPRVTTANTRQAFWAHMLNSGCAGHTYGANGVWQVNLDGAPFGKSPGGHNWGTTPWQVAMQLAGSTQLALAKKMLTRWAWHELAPIEPKSKSWQKYFKLLLKLSGYQRSVASAISTDKSLGIYYLTSLKRFSVDLSVYPNAVFASWFDPTSGDIYPISKQAAVNKGNSIMTPPGKNAAGDRDWLLVISTNRFNASLEG